MPIMVSNSNPPLNPYAYHNGLIINPGTMGSQHDLLTNRHSYGVEESIPRSKEKDLPGGGNWVVQKFGGTSVGKFAENISDIVQLVKT
jgi:hypothetical protein